MDTEWALAELRKFIDLTRLQQPRSGGGVVYMGDFASPVGSRAEIVASAQIVEQILDRVLPSWREDIEDDGKKRWAKHREAAQRAVVQIEQQSEIAVRLGDTAPSFRVSQFHPWAWDAARSLWQSGHFREAVRAASVKVNAELQNKVGRRDISEQALFQEAFSADPPQQGRSRLRPNGDDDGRSAQSVRRGIVAFAEGAFAAIRNPVSHDVLEEASEQVALEQLAAFSLLARWVEDANVHTA